MSPRAASAILLLLALSCSPLPRPSASPSAGELVDGFPQSAPHVSRWKGRVARGDESSRFRLGVSASPPGWFVLEISAPVGGMVLQASHDGQRVVVLLPRERVGFEEEADAATMERLLGLPLEPEALLAVLTGRMRPPAFAPAGGDAMPPARGGAARQGPDGRPLSDSLPVAGGGSVSVEYGRFVEAASGVLPEEITLRREGRGEPLTVTLSLRRAHTVAPRPASLFRLGIPDRFRRVRLDEVEGAGALLLGVEEGPTS